MLAKAIIMNKGSELPRLQFITGTNPRLPHSEEVREVCKAGVRFIQFREKAATVESTKRMAETAFAVARIYGAWFIVNDYIEVALDIGADGVHVGYKDASPKEARDALGNDAIIGGTANNFDHIKWLHEQEVNYMGVGPFRYTDNKEELEPILGFEGYQKLLQQMNAYGITIPTYAVGGVTIDDAGRLIANGLHGVSIGSAIGSSRDIQSSAQSLLQALEGVEY